MSFQQAFPQMLVENFFSFEIGVALGVKRAEVEVGEFYGNDKIHSQSRRFINR